jgi:hypothetical protein
MSLTSTGLLPDRMAKIGQVYGGFTIAFVLMSGAMVAIMGTTRQNRVVAQSTSPASKLAA